MRKLVEIDDFDIIGSCDSDAFFNKEWLDKTMKICLWAKKNHKGNILGPFSSFNSSDYKFHQILGTYASPYGNYVVKQRMGALNYFYFKDDFLKLGFFEEDRDDETWMTEKFKSLRVRNFCTRNQLHRTHRKGIRPGPMASLPCGKGYRLRDELGQERLAARPGKYRHPWLLQIC